MFSIFHSLIDWSADEADVLATAVWGDHASLDQSGSAELSQQSYAIVDVQDARKERMAYPGCGGLSDSVGVLPDVLAIGV